MTRSSRPAFQCWISKLALISLLFAPLGAAGFSFPQPIPAEINWVLPGSSSKLPTSPKILAECLLIDSSGGQEVTYDLSVIKDQLLRTGQVVETSSAGRTETTFPYVYSKTFTKDMLGPYSAALEAAQVLGFTQVDSARLYVVDPDPRALKTILLIYDQDGELLDRIGGLSDNWQRCR